MSLELKIKSKHLSVEAQIIRFEERKLKKHKNWPKWPKNNYESDVYQTYVNLHNHRVWDVRNENRATFLARAYLAGKKYKTVESNIKNPVVLKVYILPRVARMIEKYGKIRFQTDLKQWGTPEVRDAYAKAKENFYKDLVWQWMNGE